MPASLPDLSLTLGQVLWALNDGRPPDTLLKDRVRYLRQLGMPEGAATQKSGSGRRIRYGFHDLVELGLGVAGLKRRFQPMDICKVLVEGRAAMRAAIEIAWGDIPEAALSAPWVKSRGSIRPIPDEEIFLRLHARHTEKWGKVDLVGPDRAGSRFEPFSPVETFDDGEQAALLPLKTLMLPWVVWAMEAPVTRPGPQ